MKIKTNQIFKSYRGDNLKSKDENGKEGDLTVQEALNSAINGVEVDLRGQPVPLTAEQKGKIYHLSSKIWEAKDELQLSIEEAAFIKERAGKVVNINPLVYGTICDLLEEEKKEEVKIKEKKS